MLIYISFFILSIVLLYYKFYYYDFNNQNYSKNTHFWIHYPVMLRFPLKTFKGGQSPPFPHINNLNKSSNLSIDLPPYISFSTSLNAPKLYELLNSTYHPSMRVSMDHILWLSQLPNSNWYHFYKQDKETNKSILVACFYHRFQNVILNNVPKKQHFVDFFCILPSFRHSNNSPNNTLTYSILSMMTQLSISNSADFSIFKTDNPRFLPMKSICKSSYILSDMSSNPLYSFKNFYYHIKNNNNNKTNQLVIKDFDLLSDQAGSKEEIFRIYQNAVKNQFKLYPNYSFNDFSRIFFYQSGNNHNHKPFHMYCIYNQNSPKITIIGYFIAFKQEYINPDPNSKTKSSEWIFDISNLFYKRECKYSINDPTIWNHWKEDIRIIHKITKIGWMEHQNLSHSFAFWKQFTGNSCNWYMFNNYFSIQPSQFIAPIC
jgi:hypothetical protein